MHDCTSNIPQLATLSFHILSTTNVNKPAHSCLLHVLDNSGPLLV